MSRPGGSGRRNITDGESLASQGDAFASQGLLEEALFKYDEALRADQDFHHRNPNHPHVAMRYCSIGALYRASGDDDAALEYFAKGECCAFPNPTQRLRSHTRLTLSFIYQSGESRGTERRVLATHRVGVLP